MGADLYLMSQFEPHNELWAKRLDKALRRRDRSKEGTPEYDDAQKETERCFAEMYSSGYFRDSYNSSNLLWRFGLSWWEDFAELLDRWNRLMPKRARKFLKMLKRRETRFRTSLSELPKAERGEFEERYATLQAFLKEAIYRNEPIACSV